MLHALAKHAGWSLALNCKGDLHSTFLEHGETLFTGN
jgi:imidazoleglycerol phosphate dehydratase HisB